MCSRDIMRTIYLALAIVTSVNCEGPLISLDSSWMETPSIDQPNILVEGSNMTIDCSAMGIPIPKMSLYISGRLVRQSVSWRMVTVVHNVSREMTYVSCYADNGSSPPMEARKRIEISYKPYVTTTGLITVSYGDTVTLKCLVEANPEPTMTFWRDPMKRIPVVTGHKYFVSNGPSKDDKHKWIMQLSIESITDDELGDYFCHAENQHGNGTSLVSVRLRKVVPPKNVIQCCIEEGVSATCSSACLYYLDTDSVDKRTCLQNFDKIMRCVSDGSDHRACCAAAGVEGNCLGWCKGGVVDSEHKSLCLTNYTNSIMSCFRDGRDRLPGLPQNVRVERIDDHSATVRWDPPLKNPGSVEMYRVFWRSINPKGPPMKSDTKTTSLKITSLKEGDIYECVVKAGNSLGTSTLTVPILFNLSEKNLKVLT